MHLHDLYNGKGYPDMVRDWLIWLHSSSARYEGYRGEICFLRGNVSYIYDPQTGERRQSGDFQNRARNANDPDFFKGEVVFPDTAIFVPVISAFYSVGERYAGATLASVRECQQLCRRDIDEGGDYWCTLQRKGCHPIDLRQSVARVESSPFLMTVPEDSELRERFEIPIEAGTYETFCVARALIIKGLAIEGEYRLRFGGYGWGTYRSDSAVDFIVSNEGRRSLETTRPQHPSRVPQRPELLSFDLP